MTLQGGFAFALVDDRAEASFHCARRLAAGAQASSSRGRSGTAKAFRPLGRNLRAGTRSRSAITDRSWSPCRCRRTIPAHCATWKTASEQYHDLRLQRRRLRRTYLGLLLLLTVGVLFASTWLALYLSKMVTRPLVALAEATHEISRGRLDYRVDVQAGSEIGQLVESFNRMAADLESGRSSVEQSRRELADMNVAAGAAHAAHRNHSGERSLGRAFARRLAQYRSLQRGDPPPAAPRSGSAALGANTLRDLFPADTVSDLEHMLRKADRMGSTTSQMEIATARVNLNVAVTVASLDPPSQAASRNGRKRTGYVVVLEDLTDLLRAQKQTAWREVARRIAHEIKNPLTPLALVGRTHSPPPGARDPSGLDVAASHPAMRRHHQFVGGNRAQAGRRVLHAGALPRVASRSRPTSTPSCNEALLMFDGRLDGIQVRKFLATDLPAVQADPEAMKRAVANLVDNAAEALHDSLVKQIAISTASHRWPRLGRDRGCRHRSRRHQRSEGKALPAVLLDQAARHRAGPCDRQPHRRRSSWVDSRGRELSRGRPIYRRVASGAGDGLRRRRQSRCRPF